MQTKLLLNQYEPKYLFIKKVKNNFIPFNIEKRMFFAL